MHNPPEVGYWEGSEAGGSVVVQSKLALIMKGHCCTGFYFISYP